MPYNKEYAATINDVNTTDYKNDAPRFFCNQQITSDNIDQAKKTYQKLYKIYNTTDRDVSIQNNDILTSDCKNACPHTITNNNVFYVNTAGSFKVSDLDVYLDDCGAQIRNYDKNNNPKSYTHDLNYTQNFVDVSYNNLVRTRNDLDNKMNELLGNNRNSILYEKQNELDSSVYSTLLWTVMVTSLIYYVFVKL